MMPRILHFRNLAPLRQGSLLLPATTGPSLGTFICSRSFVTRKGRSASSTDEHSGNESSDAAHEAVLRATGQSGSSGRGRKSSLTTATATSGETDGRRNKSRFSHDDSVDEHSEFEEHEDGREVNGGHSTKAKPGTVDHRTAAHRSDNYPSARSTRRAADSMSSSSSSRTAKGAGRRGSSSGGHSLQSFSGSSGSRSGTSLPNAFGFGAALPSLMNAFTPRSLFDSPASMLQSFLPPVLVQPFNNMMGQMADPGIRVEETDDSMVVTVKCPGIPKEQLKLRLHGDVLTVSGRHVDEHMVHSLMKSVRLPMHNLDEEGVETRLENGVLRVEIPKHEEDLEEAHGREIQIN